MRIPTSAVEVSYPKYYIGTPATTTEQSTPGISKMQWSLVVKIKISKLGCGGKGSDYLDQLSTSKIVPGAILAVPHLGTYFFMGSNEYSGISFKILVSSVNILPSGTAGLTRIFPVSVVGFANSYL